MPVIHIKSAAEAHPHLDRIFSLEQQLLPHLKDQDSVSSSMEANLSDKYFIIGLTNNSGVLVALATCMDSGFLHTGIKTLEIKHLVVDEPLRHNGLGKQLMGAVHQYAKDNKYLSVNARVTLESAEKNLARYTQAGMHGNMMSVGISANPTYIPKPNQPLSQRLKTSKAQTALFEQQQKIIAQQLEILSKEQSTIGNKAATTVQKHVRGYLVRKHIQEAAANSLSR
jgi:GNAT superfamily N-acetyltransferase